MNILILSAGTRDKVVQYFKRELGESGNIIATDCSNLAPAAYEADKFYLVTRINVPGYMDSILDICKKEKIDAVFSLIDPELSMLAKERDRFLEIGTIPVVSEYELVETCFNKFEMSKLFAAHNLKTAKCYMSREDFFTAKDKNEIDYPVFVKPVCGSASMHINQVTSDEELDGLFHMYDDLMIQEYMDGTEFGADVYIDMLTGKVTGLFVKEKIKMRAGETDKSVSVKDEKLFAQIVEFVEKAGFRGMIDIDMFKIGDEYYFSEVNPRFGGGYPHAYESGVNMPALFIQNISDMKSGEKTVGEYFSTSSGVISDRKLKDEDSKELLSDRVKKLLDGYNEGIVMMKYNEVMIRNMSGETLVP